MKSWLFIILIFILAPFNISADDNPTITVLDFSTEGVSKNEMKTTITLLADALFNIKKYNVIGIKQRDKLFQEAGFTKITCEDNDCYTKIKELFNIDGLVSGNMGRIGSQYVISAELVDTSTFEVLTKSYGLYDNLETLLKDIENLAWLLMQAEIITEQPQIEEEIPVIEITDTEQAATEKPKNIITDNFFSIGAGFGLTFPLGEVERVLEMGLAPIMFCNYFLGMDMTKIFFGLTTGLQYESTKGIFDIYYDLYIIPVALNLGFSVDITKIFDISFGFMTGATINSVQYQQLREDIVTTKFFMAPVLSLGFKPVKLLRLSVSGMIPFIFFDNTTYMGMTPSINIEFFL